MVTPSKQMFYCFGCKEHGNAIDFVMKFKNLSFVEAVEEVAQFAGLNVEYEQGSGVFEKADIYKLYYELMDRCASYFTKCLNSSPEGKVTGLFVCSVSSVSVLPVSVLPSAGDSTTLS